MKKLLKTFLFLSVIFLSGLTVFWCRELTSIEYAVPDYSEFIHIVEVIRSAKRHSIFMLGDSLTQYGFHDKQEAMVDTGRECAIGDFCAFNCLDKKCLLDSDSTFIKKVKDKKDGCYYFIGNVGKYLYKGQTAESWDSHLYGWLCPGEFNIVGVISPLPGDQE